MNTLEDAFINIGLDENKYLDSDRPHELDKIDQISVPASIAKSA